MVIAEVKSGRYENASEVIRAAMRAMEREEKLRAAFLCRGILHQRMLPERHDL